MMMDRLGTVFPVPASCGRGRCGDGFVAAAAKTREDASATVVCSAMDSANHIDWFFIDVIEGL